MEIRNTSSEDSGGFLGGSNCSDGFVLGSKVSNRLFEEGTSRMDLFDCWDVDNNLAYTPNKTDRATPGVPYKSYQIESTGTRHLENGLIKPRYKMQDAGRGTRGVSTTISGFFQF